MSVSHLLSLVCNLILITTAVSVARQRAASWQTMRVWWQEHGGRGLLPPDRSLDWGDWPYRWDETHHQLLLQCGGTAGHPLFSVCVNDSVCYHTLLKARVVLFCLTQWPVVRLNRGYHTHRITAQFTVQCVGWVIWVICWVHCSFTIKQQPTWSLWHHDKLINVHERLQSKHFFSPLV